MGSMSVWHWLIVLLVIVLLFGAKKIPELAKGLGSGIRTFKKELDKDQDDVAKKDNADVTQTTSKEAKSEPTRVEVIEAQIVDSNTSSNASSPSNMASKSGEKA